MELECLSISFQSADAAVREQVAISQHTMATLLDRLQHHYAEALVLSTCNRTEVYAVREGEARPLSHELARFLEMPVTALDAAGVVLHGADAVFHLLKLACGLESMVIGETEIFGQIKAAYANAMAAGAAGKVLNRLFQRTFAIAKQIRSGTDIGRYRVSVASIAAQTVVERLPDPASAKVAVWGTGAVGRAVVHALARLGVPGGMVLGRSLHRARLLAGGWHGTAHLGTEAEAILQRCDVFIACTGAPHAVIHRGIIPPERKLLLVDLAMPRDIQEDVRDCPRVTLLNIDDLAPHAQKGSAARLAVRERILPGLQGEAEVLWSCLHARQFDHDLARWREEAHRDLHQELEALFAEEPHLDEADRARFDALAHRLLSRLIERQGESIPMLYEADQKER